MKSFPAVAILEFRSISTGIQTTDAMLKKSPISFIKSGTITRGRYLTVIGGTTASVDEAFEEGLFWGANDVLDRVFLPDVHPDVFNAMFGKRGQSKDASLLILETASVAGNIRAAEAVLKGTPVEIIELRMADDGLSGKGLSIFAGELHDVEEAIALASAFMERADVEYTHRILTSPHEALGRQLADTTKFHEAEALNLEGELGYNEAR